MIELSEAHLFEIKEMLKHLAGRHNQQTHGNRFGSASSSVDGLSEYTRHKMLSSAYADQIQKLLFAQKDAIREYTGDGYSLINYKLRQNEDMTPDARQEVDDATSALKSGSAPFAFTVKRGLSLSDPTVMFADLKKKVGKTFTDPAFVSTTSDDSVKASFGNDIIFHIHVPKGAKGLYVDNISSHPGEHEFLLPPGSKFKVLKAQMVAGSFGVQQRIVTLGLAMNKNAKMIERTLEEVHIKHLPGRHDQQAHANRFGSVATSEKSPLAGLDDLKKRNKLVSEYDEHIEKLSPDQLTGIKKYTGGAFQVANFTLREGEIGSPSIKKLIEDTRSAVELGVAPYSFMVKRGIALTKDDAKDVFQEFVKNTGKVFTDPAFVSSTSDSGTSKFGKSIAFEIHVPRGAKGLYVDDISTMTGENEFLMPPGSKFKVIRTEVVKDASGVDQRKVVLGLLQTAVKNAVDEQEEKHLPGRHNQQTHGNRFGSASASFNALDADSKHLMLEKLYSDQIDKLGGMQSFAIESYTGAKYLTMNHVLRTNSTPNDSLKRIINEATNGLMSGSAPINFTVKRGIELDDPAATFADFQKKVGKTFTDPAFVSTTVLDSTKDFGKDIVFHIHVPKGAKGLYVNSISEHQGEHEFLLPPGSKFKVLKAEIVDGSFGVKRRVVTLGLAMNKNVKMMERTLEEIHMQIKHLPGRHDQQAHANRYGNSRANATLGSYGTMSRQNKMSDAYRTQVQALTPEEHDGIAMYTGGSFQAMNEHLRDGSDVHPIIQQRIVEAAAGLNTGSAPFAFSVSRGIEVPNPDSLFKEFQGKIGKTFTDPAFVSTTVKKSAQAFGDDITFEIHVPRGAKGLYVDEISHFSHEAEFLFPPKSTFKVLGTEIRAGKRIVMLGAQKSGIKRFLVQEIKHLPGRHNQQTHANRYGSASASSASPLAAMGDYQKKLHLKDAYKDQVESLSKIQQNAIKSYTGVTYSTMNKALRNDAIDGLSTTMRNSINNAADGLKSGIAPFAFTVSRGISLWPEAKAEQIFQEFAKKTGKTFIDPAFVSTTSNKDSSFGSSIKFEIHVSKGSPGLFVEELSKSKGENEFLIPPGAKFKVLKTEVITTGYSKQRVVTLGLQRMKMEPLKKPKTPKIPKSSGKSFQEIYFHLRETPSSVKHLPGRHDQQTHGNRFGSPSMTEKSPMKTMNDYVRDAHMSDAYKPWLKSLDGKEEKAIETYTGMEYEKMNKQLRTGEDLGMGEMINEAMAGLHKGRTPFAFCVNRIIGSSNGGADAFWKQANKSIGKTFTDLAFVSTSTNEKKSEGGGSFIVVKIHVPKGAKGGYVDPISQFSGEHEFLLPPKTRFKVLKTSTNVNGLRIVELGMAK